MVPLLPGMLFFAMMHGSTVREQGLSSAPLCERA
jgi:hypothetical protein